MKEESYVECRLERFFISSACILFFDEKENGRGSNRGVTRGSFSRGFSLRIPVSNHFYVANSPDPAGYTLEINYKEKQTTAQQVSGQTVVFEDFEDETGAQVPAGYNSGKSHRGSWTHSLDTSGGPYVVDYRVYRNGKWNYVRQSASGSSVTISEGTAPIDHVRIYPLGSMPESYTWNDDGTLRSRTDSRGVTESYRYDGLGRLTGVYDNDGNKVEGYQYNYKNR